MNLMGDIFIRRELPFPPGLNTGFVTGCFRLAIDSVLAKKQHEEMKELGPVHWELSISLVDNREIRDVNNRFRNINEATDVLSFPQYEPEELDEFLITSISFTPLVLGDVVISLEWIEEHSDANPDVIRRSFAWMAVHGVLHLFGLDHDSDMEDKRMREEETRILLEIEDFISSVRS
jgi:probable rRNA maturation factor